MSDDADPQPPGTPPPRRAPELGFASLFLGLAVLVTSPLFLLVTPHFARTPGMSKLMLALMTWLPRLAMAAPALLTLFGFLLGLRGLRRARQEDGSRALPAAGLALNLTAMSAWTLTTAYVIAVTEKL